MKESEMMKESFEVSGKTITLYKAEQTNQPLVVINMFESDGSTLIPELQKIGTPHINLLVISNLNWNSDLSPWEIPSFLKQEPPFTGEADTHLQWLLNEVIPKAKERIEGTPEKTYIAGYSMAGLFALYALYQCDVFDRAACMSSSFWYPKFKEYALSNKLKRTPEKMYFSLGDKEAKTKHPILKTVQENTEAIVEHFKQSGVDVTFEMNEGNHFKDVDWRIVRGIVEMCK